MINKKLLTSLFLSFIAIFSFACSDTSTETQTPKEPKIVMKTLDVKGMTCESCEGTIVSYVTKVDGVVSSKASHVKESVIVKYDESKTNITAIMNTISKVGYKVNGIKKADTDK
ncbi:cation transporter [Sulfurimonas sp.]|nr:cation transporter [Sulfurimonas sp.]